MFVACVGRAALPSAPIILDLDRMLRSRMKSDWSRFGGENIKMGVWEMRCLMTYLEIT